MQGKGESIKAQEHTVEMSEDTSSGDVVDLDDERQTASNESKEQAMEKRIPAQVLPCIIFSQFAGTSLWFAGNAVQEDFADEFNLPDSSLSLLTSAVQAGFVVGTLFVAIFNVADRLMPTHVFAASAWIGALMNALIPILVQGTAGMFTLRFITGVALAGIYPVGVKVASDWYQSGLGHALGLLVGALVFGTAFPFLLNLVPQPWEYLLWETSILAATGGLVMLTFVPNGPYRKAATKFQPGAAMALFRSKPFAAAAFGYFGHMWELYAFWAWCPTVWKAYLERHEKGWDESFVTFAVIATGVVSCAVGGWLSPRIGSGRVAVFSLVISGACCLLSPIFFYNPIVPVTLIFYLIWGAAVISDSPQFFALAAAAASSSEYRGSALAVVLAIGFGITIGSIHLLEVPISEAYLFLLLAPGPLLALYYMRGFFFSKTGE